MLPNLPASIVVSTNFDLALTPLPIRSVIYILVRLVFSLGMPPGSCTSFTACEVLSYSHRLRYLLEHGLKPDGRPDPNAESVGEDGSFDTFFTETASGKYVPRSIFVDLDPSVSGVLFQ